VYFSTCCGGSNVAYYKFTGTQLGTLFNASQPGEISFNLKSLKSWAQRSTAPSYNYRMIFNVEADAANAVNHSYFYATASGGSLVFAFNMGATGGFYYIVPTGQQDTLFGNGVIMPVRIVWDGTTVSLYLNGNLVSGPTPYTPAAASWNSGSIFVLSGDAYLNNVYDVSDDIVIDEFQVK
jgi:hypothetical protein